MTVSAARIEVTGPAGPQQVTARPGLGLALAAAMEAPVRIADALMVRLAVPVTGDDLLGPFLDRRQGRPAGPLPEPRNLAFASGPDDRIIGGRFKAGSTIVHR